MECELFLNRRVGREKGGARVAAPARDDEIDENLSFEKSETNVIYD